MREIGDIFFVGCEVKIVNFFFFVLLRLKFSNIFFGFFLVFVYVCWCLKINRVWYWYLLYFKIGIERVKIVYF